MTVIRLALLELRRFRGRMARLVPVVLCLVPLLYGAMYLWANWDPYGKIDRIPVAVVNQDVLAHTSEGQRVEAGQEIVQNLKAAHTFDWHFVSAQRARDGLEDGTYYLTITIPPSFSRDLATAGTDRPQHAHIEIRSNDANNYIVGVMAETVQPELQDQINSATHAAYVRAIYGELSKVRDELQAAASGADRLVDATAVAQRGATSLEQGTRTVQAGSADLTRGARQLATAADRLASATSDISSAAGADLPSITSAAVNASQLAVDSANLVRAGTSRVASLADTTVNYLEDLQRNYPILGRDGDFIGAMRAAKDGRAAAHQIDSDASNVMTAAGNAHSSALTLNSRVGSLPARLSSASSTVQLVASAAHSVSSGAGTVTSGLRALASGSSTLHQSATEAHSGAQQIATITHRALRQVPPTDADTTARAAEVLGSPTRISRTDIHPAGAYGRGFAPFFFGIALWVFGLFAYVFLPPYNRRALTSGLNAVKVAIAGWLPAAGLGLIAALVLYGVVDLTLRLDPQLPVLLVLLLATAVAAFVAIDHFLKAALGAVGAVLSLVLLILQLTASGGLYPMETTPGFFRALHPLLPMTYLVDGLRMTVSGGSGAHLARDFVVLAMFAVAFLGFTTLTVRRHRSWTPARLHPEVTL